MKKRSLIHRVVAASLWFAGAVHLSMAQAQEFPSRLIKFVVPFAPGSGTDTSAR